MPRTLSKRKEDPSPTLPTRGRESDRRALSWIPMLPAAKVGDGQARVIAAMLRRIHIGLAMPARNVEHVMRLAEPRQPAPQ